MWGTAYNTHAITCDACRRDYRLVDFTKAIHLYRVADEKKSDRLHKPVLAAQSRIDRELLAPVRELICQEAQAEGRTYAKKAPYVQQLFGVEYTVDSVRAEAKRAGSFDNWIGQMVTTKNCRRLASELGIKVPYAEVMAEHGNAKAAYDAFQVKPAKVYTRQQLDLDTLRSRS